MSIYNSLSDFMGKQFINIAVKQIGYFSEIMGMISLAAHQQHARSLCFLDIFSYIVIFSILQMPVNFKKKK